MQQTSLKSCKTRHDFEENDDPQEIMREIKIQLCYKMVYTQTRNRHRDFEE